MGSALCFAYPTLIHIEGMGKNGMVSKCNLMVHRVQCKLAVSSIKSNYKNLI